MALGKCHQCGEIIQKQPALQSHLLSHYRPGSPVREWADSYVAKRIGEETDIARIAVEVARESGLSNLNAYELVGSIAAGGRDDPTTREESVQEGLQEGLRLIRYGSVLLLIAFAAYYTKALALVGGVPIFSSPVFVAWWTSLVVGGFGVVVGVFRLIASLILKR